MLLFNEYMDLGLNFTKEDMVKQLTRVNHWLKLTQLEELPYMESILKELRQTIDGAIARMDMQREKGLGDIS